MLKLPRLESLGSFKVSASVSEAATSRLGLVRDFKRLVSVSAQKVSCTSLAYTTQTVRYRT